MSCRCCPPPGGALPASLGQGDLLKGDGSGGWVSNPNLPTVAPGSEGQILFWDGTSRYRYSAVPTSTGQILQWDETSNTWVLTAAPANGNVLVFDSGTGLWVPQAPTPAPAPLRSDSFTWGATAVANATTYMWAEWTIGTTQSAESAAGFWIVPYDGVLSELGISHAASTGATNITYTIRTGATPGTMANTALAVVLSSAGAGAFDLATAPIPLTRGTLVSLQAVQASGGTLTTRPRATASFLET